MTPPNDRRTEGNFYLVVYEHRRTDIHSVEYQFSSDILWISADEMDADIIKAKIGNGIRYISNMIKL